VEGNDEKLETPYPVLNFNFCARVMLIDSLHHDLSCRAATQYEGSRRLARAVSS